MATTVDKIRRALEKRDGIAEEEMLPLAEAYRTQVQQVNQRLDDSVMLLRKGLRSEAIQRIEMTPNALDAAAELDFPEWDEWNEILQFMGIPLPPALNHDYVNQINEAIIESLPLDALLRRHRRLAIAKAPLGVRLRTLRQIARVDSANKVWNEDVEAWEKIRLQQIDSELKTALEREDAKYLYELHQELTGGPWRIAPSSRMIEQSTFAAEAHLRTVQEKELKRITPAIQAAFEQKNEVDARQYRTEWQAVRSKYKLSVPQQYQTAVAPAMQWLEDLDRQSVMESERAMAVANLESSLQSGKPLEEVKRAYDRASQFGASVPEQLSQQVEKLSEAPRKQQQRKLQLLIGGGVALAIVLIVVAAIAVSSSSKEAAKNLAIGQMKTFVDGGQFEEAINYYSSLQQSKPELAAEPTMIAMHSTAKESVEKENFRVERFKELLQQADHDDPSLIDERLLPQLQELAVTEFEKTRVADLVRKKEKYNLDEEIRQSKEMLDKLSEYQTSFNELQSRGNGDVNRQAIQSLLATVSRLPSQFPRHSEEVAAKQGTLRSLISSTLREMKDLGMISEQRKAAIEVLVSARSLEAYSDQLRDYSTQSVSRTKFIDFSTVLREESHWLNVDRVNGWLAELDRTLEKGINDKEAVKLSETAAALKRIVDPNPVFDDLSRFESDMTEIAKRRQMLDDLFSRIKQHPLAQAVTLELDDSESPSGKKIYFLNATYAEENSDRFSRAGSIGVMVISNAIGASRNRSFSGPLPKIIREPLQSISEFLDQKIKQRAEFDSNWEQTFINHIVEIVKDPDMDGVVKEWLISHLIDTASRGSQRFADAVPQTKRMLERRSSVREKWYSERAKDTDLNEALADTIRSELNIAFNRFSDPLEKYRSTAKKRLQWLGFLAKSMSGEIETHVRGALPEYDGELVVAVASRDGQSTTSLLPIGKLTKGHITLTPNQVYQVPGRPIFLYPN